MTTKKRYEIMVNRLIPKTYPFIENIEVYRLRSLFMQIDVDVNLFVGRDFMLKNVMKQCIEDIPNNESIFMSLFSFNLCSRTKIPTNNIETLLEEIYRHTISNDNNMFLTNISVLCPNSEGEF